MRKIIIAFDSTNYSDAALRFASRLNEISAITLVGAFVPQTDIANLWAYVGGHNAGSEFIPLVGDDNGEQIKENIKHFENYCIDNGIDYKIHKDYFDFAIPELKKETRFADLLILSSETFYANMGNEPNEFLGQALHDVECPILLVPNNFAFPTCNILTYDGSGSSVYAIKHFAYLLPEFVTNETILVHATEHVSEPLPELLNVEELVARHFPDFNILELGNPKKAFATWLNEKKAGIVVSGSFGRSGLYRLFHKSFVAETIKKHKIPLFIAHK